MSTLAARKYGSNTNSKNRSRSGWALLATAAATLVSGLGLGASGAGAAAYTKAVYAPNSVSSGTVLKSDADLSRDCAGTFGCSNYMKIERKRAWGIQFVGGGWVNNSGRNSIQVAKPYGCFNYRTTVDSYNDVAGSYGSGVNVGPIGFSSNGTKIYRYKTTWSSGWKYHCR